MPAPPHFAANLDFLKFDLEIKIERKISHAALRSPRGLWAVFYKDAKKIKVGWLLTQMEFVWVRAAHS